MELLLEDAKHIGIEHVALRYFNAAGADPKSETKPDLVNEDKEPKRFEPAPTELTQKTPPVSLGRDGVNVQVDDNIKVQFYQENKDPMVGVSFKFMPNPTADGSISSICGSGSFDSIMNNCFFGDGNNMGGSNFNQSNFGPDDKPALGLPSGSAAMIGDTACAEFIKHNKTFKISNRLPKFLIKPLLSEA